MDGYDYDLYCQYLRMKAENGHLMSESEMRDYYTMTRGDEE